MNTDTKAEKPLARTWRVYAKHRKIITKWTKKLKITDAELVRRALDKFDISQ